MVAAKSNSSFGPPSDDSWIEKALVAVDAGYSPMDVALAPRGSHWGGWGPMSRMWQKWVDNFTPLLEHENASIRTVGKAGMEWSTAERDRALRKERNDDVYGRFDD